MRDSDIEGGFILLMCVLTTWWLFPIYILYKWISKGEEKDVWSKLKGPSSS